MKKLFVFVLLFLTVFSVSAKKIDKKYCQICGNDAIVWLAEDNAYECSDCFAVHDSESLRKYGGSYVGGVALGTTDESSCHLHVDLNGGYATFEFGCGNLNFKEIGKLTSNGKNYFAEFKNKEHSFRLDFIEFGQTNLIVNLTYDGNLYTGIYLQNDKWRWSQWTSTVKNVETTKNAVFNVPAVKIEKTDDPNVVKIAANPKRGYWYSAYLWIPEDPSKAAVNNLYCFCASLETCAATNATEERAYEVACSGNIIKNGLNTPELVFSFPRIFYFWGNDVPGQGSCDMSVVDFKQTAIMQRGILRRIDNQMAALIKDALEYLNRNYAPMASKVIMSGYSMTGHFAAAFPMLHPELVQASVDGAAYPMLPVKTYNGKKVTYNLGMYDFKDYIGYDFNLEEWQKVHMLYTRGVYDASNDNPFWMYGEQFKQIDEVFREPYSDCFDDMFAILSGSSDHVETVFYTHNCHEQVDEDVLSFLLTNCSEEFVPLDSIEDIAIVNKNKEYQYVSENCVEFKSERELGDLGYLHLRFPTDERGTIKIVLDGPVPSDSLYLSSGTLRCVYMEEKSSGIYSMVFQDLRNYCTVELVANINRMTDRSVICDVFIGEKKYSTVCFISDNTRSQIETAKSLMGKRAPDNTSGAVLREPQLRSIIDNNSDFILKCSCGNSEYVFRNPNYCCTKCGKTADHEVMMGMAEGIWHGNALGKDFVIYQGKYDSPDKYISADGELMHSSSAGNWYKRMDTYACREFIGFKNNENAVFMLTVSKNRMICDMIWDGKYVSGVVFTRE